MRTATSNYSQDISISLIWDNRFLFILHSPFAWKPQIRRPCCIPTANRTRGAPSPVQSFVVQGTRRSAAGCKDPKREQKRWRGLVGVISSSLDTSLREHAGRSRSGDADTWMLPLNTKGVQKVITALRYNPPPLYVPWFWTGLKTRQIF